MYNYYYDDDDDVDDHYNIIIIRRRGSVGAPTVSRNFAGSSATACNRAPAGPTTARGIVVVAVIVRRLRLRFVS